MAEEFIQLVQKRDSVSVSSLLEGNADLVNSTDSTGSSGLHYAATNGDIPMLDVILKLKPKDVNLVNVDGLTPISAAVKADQREAIKFLIESGADVNFANKAGVTAAHHAATTTNVALMKFLATLGAGVYNAKTYKSSESGSVLHWAASTGDVKTVGTVLHDLGVPVDVADSHGGSALLISVHSKKSDIVTFLLEQGANPNLAVPEDGSTPLHVAADVNSVEDIKTLIAFAADATIKNKAGKTPIDIATEKKEADAIKEVSRALKTKEKRSEDATRFKTQGNKVFGKGENVKAAKFYSLAITLEPTNHVFFSNRAASYFNNQNFTAAYYDACRAIQLKPDWPKGYLRKAATETAMGNSDIAEKTIALGLSQDRNNRELIALQGEINKGKSKKK